MEAPLSVSLLNDFIFCPASVYFHMVDAETEKMTYGSREQMQGSALHEAVDTATYSTSAKVLQGVQVFCEKYGLVGKIDLFDLETGILRERKRRISSIYDGQIFQLYAYCLALREMGYSVRGLQIYSMQDHKTYDIPLPEEDAEMFGKFCKTVQEIKDFSPQMFMQKNARKCEKCVYEPLCSYSARIEL